MMPKALILDANQRSALTAVRSLGCKGVSVYTADESNCSLAGVSRYSNKYSCYPSPSKLPAEFIEKLVDIVQRESIEIIIPMTELTTSLVLENKARFPSVALPFADLSDINAVSNKCSLMRMAETLNIPIPQTIYINKPDELDTNLDELNYPIILKPGKSWLTNHTNQWLHTSVRLVKSASEAKKLLSDCIDFQLHPFMIQECVEGVGQGIFALYNKGKAVAFFSHRRIREKPPWGGVSVLSESVQINPLLLKHSQALLDKANWHGIAMVEYKVNKDGTPYLMEINTRFWGSLQLAVDAGVDFPWLLYKLSAGIPIEAVNDYKTGIRLRWLLGDLDSLYIYMKDRNTTVFNKIKAIFRFLKPAPFITRHEINRLSDIRPFWWELKQYIKDIIK